MAVDKLVDSTQLDADLTSVANAIRTKGGTSADLAFPAGFVSAVEAIPTGGGGGNKRYLIKNGKIQDGFTFQAYSPTVISEDAVGFFSQSVTGNDYADVYVNGVDFSGFTFLIVEFFLTGGVAGWSWNSENANQKYPSVNAGSGNAPKKGATNSTHFGFFLSSANRNGSYITTECAIVDVSTLTTGNIKVCVSGTGAHPSAYINIKNMYLLEVS